MRLRQSWGIQSCFCWNRNRFHLPSVSQIETIRNMALLNARIILQRFSSIEKELNAVEQQAENDARIRVRAARAGA